MESLPNWSSQELEAAESLLLLSTPIIFESPPKESRIDLYDNIKNHRKRKSTKKYEDEEPNINSSIKMFKCFQCNSSFPSGPALGGHKKSCNLLINRNKSNSSKSLIQTDHQYESSSSHELHKNMNLNNELEIKIENIFNNQSNQTQSFSQNCKDDQSSQIQMLPQNCEVHQTNIRDVSFQEQEDSNKDSNKEVTKLFDFQF